MPDKILYVWCIHQSEEIRVNFKLCKLTRLLVFFVSGSSAAVEFTKDELELVKDACLAGSNFEFKTEVDGSISVKNLEGKGKFLVSKKEVTTVDLPDADKQAEFKEIRACIKSYLTKSPAPQASAVVLKEWNFLIPHDGTTPAVSFRKVRLIIDDSSPVEFTTVGFADTKGAWGFRYRGVNLRLAPVDHTATFEIEYSINEPNSTSTGTASCSAILSGKRSIELTPDIRATFEGNRMRILSCTFN